MLNRILANLMDFIDVCVETVFFIGVIRKFKFRYIEPQKNQCLLSFPIQTHKLGGECYF